jgi:SSS family solute:Na+ symporter
VPGFTILLLALYLAAVLAIGVFSRKRAGRSEAAFFVADRSFGPFWGFLWLASLTTGGSTTIALAALVATHGASGLWFDVAGAAGLMALGLLLAGRVRREGAVTLPEIVGRHYGDGARRAAAALVLVSEIVWFALLVEATQVVLTAAFGLNPIPAIVGSTAVFILYTTLGGQFAVVRTDLVQYGLMVIGIPVAAAAGALARVGPARIVEAARVVPSSAALTGGQIAAFFVLIGLPHLVGSDVYQKVLSCRDERSARTAALLASASKILFGVSVTVIALAARAALPPGPAVETLPRAILSFLPGPLASLVLVCLVATMHSSADAVLLSASAVTVRDLAPPKNERAGVALARVLAPLYGALGLLVALALRRDVLETLKLGYSIFAAALILPVLAAVAGAGPILPSRGAIAAMLAGGAVAAIGRLDPGWTGGVDPVILGTSVNALVLLGAVALKRGRAGP